MEISLMYIDLQTYLVVLVRLAISVILGALIGIERASTKHDAGLRTHIIVCLGSASVMIISQLINKVGGNITDVTRLGAQVISGIGFLGVGSIIVNKNRVRGLTTAAGLWTTACLGLVIGAGFIEIALTVVALMMFTIFVLRPLSLKIRSNDMSFEIAASLLMHAPNEYVETLVKMNFSISSVKVSNEKVVILIHKDSHVDKNELIHSLISIDGVTSVSET